MNYEHIKEKKLNVHYLQITTNIVLAHTYTSEKEVKILHGLMSSVKARDK